MSTRFERIIREPSVDDLVKEVTAMKCWADLEVSLRDHGYIPTLICYPGEPEDRHEAKKALTKVIRERGYQVWEGSKGPKVTRRARA